MTTEKSSVGRAYAGVAMVVVFAFAQASLFAAESPVVVKGKNVEWTYRKTATGCIIDFSNKVGRVVRSNGTSYLNQRAISHAEVFYKPNGKTYTFDIAPAGKLSVALGGPMPCFPKRFADTNLYAAVDIPVPFDVGVTAERPSQRVISNRCHEKFLIKTVPCAMYTRAFVLCADSGDAAKEPAFTVRLTRWMDDSEWNYTGRAHEGMFEAKVDLRTAKKEQIGKVKLGGKTVALWCVEVPVDLGDYQDIVKTDKNGNFLGDIGRYLDFEFLGPTIGRCAPLGDRSMDTDPRRVSSVTVYGARLEYPAAEFAMRWSEPGNVFHNDDRPVTFADVIVNRPGSYAFSWTISDVEGNVVGTGEKAVAGDALGKPQGVEVDLAQDRPGWYSLVWTLADAGGRTLMTHNASFAILGEDTRTSGFGEGPYGIGSAYSWHYRIPDANYQDGAKLALKLGMRHFDQPKYGGYKLTVEERRKWKVGTSLFSVLDRDYGPAMNGKKTEEQLAAEMRKRLEDDPNTTLCQLFWESHPNGYAQAPELTGGVYDPAKAYKGASNRVAMAKAATKFMRKYFPQIKITLGNTLACTELIAELIRGGLPEGNADYMGLEVVGRDNLPERQWNSSLQSADYFRLIAQHFGYDSWKPGSGVENNYRLDKVIGEDRQAWWYVRDQVLGQCWRFPSIHVGDLVDAGNQYTETMWGGSGICRRWPYLYPKKAYVGMATTTKMLDMVTDASPLATGDDCVYAVKFARRDGKTVYGFWTSRARAELELTLKRGDWKAVDFYGRPLDLAGDGLNWVPFRDTRVSLVAGEALSWIVADGDLLKSVSCASQSAPDPATPAGFSVAVKCDDASAWKLVEGETPDVHTGLGNGTPCRVRAKNASFALVDDPEAGKCLELDLGKPDLSLPKPAMEYMTLELKEPVVLKGDPKSIGMRVKGNSGWGRLYWIVEGADGVRTVSSGNNQWKDEFDYNGRMTVCCGCWSFMRYPLAETTSITDYSTYIVEDLWSRGCVKYPAKLVGVVFAAESRPLFLTERRLKKQKIRISDIGFFDAGK